MMHTDDMNDLVSMGIARDTACAEATELRNRTKELEEILSLRTNLHGEAIYLVEALEAERDALKAKLEAAVEDKQDAIDTLNAWFDRRKLGHEAVDQAIVDAASGYLRTSRVGGMPQEESDLVLGVIQDMARLGLFADLFARATLAKLKGGDQ